MTTDERRRLSQIPDSINDDSFDAAAQAHIRFMASEPDRVGLLADELDTVVKLLAEARQLASSAIAQVAELKIQLDAHRACIRGEVDNLAVELNDVQFETTMLPVRRDRFAAAAMQAIVTACASDKGLESPCHMKRIPLVVNVAWKIAELMEEAHPANIPPHDLIG